MSRFPKPVQKLISHLRKLPGVGGKTAERFAFKLLEWNEESLDSLAQTVRSIAEEVRYCECCGCLRGPEPCDFCNLNTRDTGSLCIVSTAKDVYPVEETGVFKGLYHVLGGNFSPLEGRDFERIDVGSLRDRVFRHGIKDVLFALDSTLEGDATALFLKEEMKEWGVNISRPAFGIPLGSALDYVDPGTLARALLGRNQF